MNKERYKRWKEESKQIIKKLESDKLIAKQPYPFNEINNDFVTYCLLEDIKITYKHDTGEKICKKCVSFGYNASKEFIYITMHNKHEGTRVTTFDYLSNIECIKELGG